METVQQHSDAHLSMKKRFFFVVVGVVWAAFCAGGMFITSQVYLRRVLHSRIGDVNQQGRALWWVTKVYCDSHGGKLPPAATWEDDVAKAAKMTRSQMDQFVLCPLPRPVGSSPRRFALNRAVAGQPFHRFDYSPHAVLFFESSGSGRNICDPLTTLAPPSVNGNEVTTCVAYISGWVDRVPSKQIVGYASWAAKQIKPIPAKKK